MFEVGVRECGEGILNLWWCAMYFGFHRIRFYPIVCSQLDWDENQ